MIGRIRGRAAFERLRRQGLRIRTTNLWCTFVIDPAAEPPRVAFAIGRAVGPAVVRNRLRRQLREILRTAGLPPGWYLVGARPSATALDHQALRREAGSLLAKMRPAVPST